MIIKTDSTLVQDSIASYDDEMVYRYTLSRSWTKGPALTFLMLNPSTATEAENDPTIERCQRRAIAMRFGQLHIVNLFPLRSTDPAGLLKTDPIGDLTEANKSIIEAVKLSDMTICAWGNHQAAKSRSWDVIKLLRAESLEKKLYCLARNKDGSPKHPLYVSAATQPIKFFE
ncbi:DUF1643 domain-containing protein [Methylophilus sp. QUAN]|uniref:DUF1643 domain-containing protein n=1 Tax=Methylophilus sp. QUAN TaxID=2781020 RepID=UPI001E2B48CA|nr:DUF1643 domain-containing protein [Methylophilus sp. QUAN]